MIQDVLTSYGNPMSDISTEEIGLGSYYRNPHGHDQPWVSHVGVLCVLESGWGSEDCKAIPVRLLRLAEELAVPPESGRSSLTSGFIICAMTECECLFCMIRDECFGVFL